MHTAASVTWSRLDRTCSLIQHNECMTGTQQAKRRSIAGAMIDIQPKRTWSTLRATHPQSDGGADATPGFLRMEAQGGWKQPCFQVPLEP